MPTQWVAFRAQAGDRVHRIGKGLDRVYGAMARAAGGGGQHLALGPLLEEECWLLRALLSPAPGRRPDWSKAGEACLDWLRRNPRPSSVLEESEAEALAGRARPRRGAGAPAGRAQANGLVVHAVVDLDELFDVDAVTQEHLFRLHAYAADCHKRLGFDHRSDQSPVPRYTDWRPMRFAIMDRLFGFADFRYNRDDACVEVRCYGALCHPGADVFAGTRGVLSALLGEALRRGADSVCFLRPQDPRRPAGSLVQEPVPADVSVFAGLLPDPVSLDRQSGRIAKDQIASMGRQLAAGGGSGRSPEEALAILSGRWTGPDVEALEARLPASLRGAVLSGRVPAEAGVVYMAVLQHLRAAVFVGVLDRYVRALAERAGGTAQVVSGAPAELKGHCGRAYQCTVDLAWESFPPRGTVAGLVLRCTVPAGRRFIVATRAGDWAEIWRWREEDLSAAAGAGTAVQVGGSCATRGFLALSRDVRYLSEDQLHEYLAAAEKRAVFVLPLDLTCDELSGQAMRRLAREGEDP